MKKAPRFLVGLGNPSEKYAWTRHNVGRHFIDYLLDETSSDYEKSRQAELFRLPAFFDVSLPEPLLCARLTCYMNMSGPALKEILAKHQLEAADALVAVDDFTIPFGHLRLRMGGSAGGHNGLKSIIETLQTEDFPRIRFGIGPVPPGGDPAEFVLDRFATSEKGQLPLLFRAAQETMKAVFTDGYEKAMSATNKMHL